MCSQRKISGVIREGRSWKIPIDAKKPKDCRIKTTENIWDIIDRKKLSLMLEDL